MTTTSDAINGSVTTWDALVANPGPDGVSLREALTVAQLTTGPKEIGFDPVLKGAIIAVFSEVTARLPFLTSGDLTLDGDIDGDGQPDITLDGAAGKGVVGTPLCFLVWSSHNHLNGLHLQNFAAYSIVLSPNSRTAGQSVTGNRFTNHWIDTKNSNQAGIHVNSTGWFPGAAINDCTWRDTFIAGNQIVANSVLYGIVIGGGLGTSRNQFLGTIIQDNVISGGRVTVYLADTNSTFDGDFNPPKAEPAIYSDGNLIDELLIKSNRITCETAGSPGILIAVANDGNCGNRINRLTIAENTITLGYRSLADGIGLGCSRPINASRPCQDNVLEDVLIEKNVIESPRYGIYAGVSGSGVSKFRPIFPGESGNRINRLTIRENIIRNQTFIGISVFAASGDTGPQAAQDNCLVGLEIVDNDIVTDQQSARAGIAMTGGFTLKDDGKQASGPARLNSIESASIIGNRVSGGAIPIKILGGNGLGAADNHITNLVILDNDTDLPPVVLDNDLGATGNTVQLIAPTPPPAITAQPQGRTVAEGGDSTLTVSTTSIGPISCQWQQNGRNLSGETSASLSLINIQPDDAGLYTATVTCGGTTTSDPAIIGLTTTSKVIGTGTELQPTDIHHPNGNVFDQVLLEGAAESITADHALNQITRTSYVDLNDDIVQVEFSGPGTLSLVLDNPSGPALPAKYNQAVNYMKGHAGIVITGATKDTNVSVFTVGRITAVNQTLFKDGVTYDGVADIAFIAIASTDGQFGGVRTADASYFATRGYTGIYAPGVTFNGPVYVGDLSAFDAATPVLLLGGALGNTWINGGDLLQNNGQSVKVSGITQLKFVAGGDSHGNSLTAKTNLAVLKQNGNDVTSQIVVNPTP